jgi:acetoin utilization deacetylase AcuC-like enzyme
MLTFYSDTHRLHHGSELKDGHLMPCFEEPGRADTILQRVLQSQLGTVLPGQAFDASCYARVHSARYVRFLQQAWDAWQALGHQHHALPLVWPVRDLRHDIEPQHIDGKLGFYAMDAGVAITPGTWAAVSASANLALSGMQAVLGGEQAAFALCRPPGHHAAAEYMGGYCYLNNAAIAAQYARDHGAARVAVLDIDFHHGNGTQSIFYQRSDVQFISLHGDPLVSYPYFSGHADETGSGDGAGYNLNLPLAHGTAWDGYQVALAHACQRLQAYRPDVLVVSLGVDTFKDDPISHFLLDSEHYSRIGAMLGALGLPTLFVMEGGYMVDAIGSNTVNVLAGFSGQ